VGTQIVERNYPITGETLGDLPRIFATGIEATDPDMIYGIFSGDPGDTAVGYGYLPGRTAIGYVYGEAFRHEVGHNAGGSHCHEVGGSYNHGYNNSKSSTAQCGNTHPYYSTPAVNDAYGLPLGNAATADMARVWRENADRLSSYAHFPKAPTNFHGEGLNGDTVAFIWNPSPRAVRYEIWRSFTKIGESTTVNFIAYNVPTGRQRHHVVAVYSDNTKSPRSDYIWVGPRE
jgi:hypothetical protein